MTTLLAVKAHPLTPEASKSMNVFYAFIDQYQKSHPDDVIQVLDLFQEDFPEIDYDIMTGWNTLAKGSEFQSLTENQQKKISRFNEATEQFLNADKLVIGNGLWNLNIPTRLKAWFDTINVAGKTFRYTDTGPIPLTQNKKALHIQANGGIYEGQDFASQYVRNMLNFVGVNDVQQVFIEGADYQPERTEEIVEKAVVRVQEISTNF